MKVIIHSYDPGRNLGNIMFAGRWPMKGGEFPKDHPVGGTAHVGTELGTGPNIQRFRELGYWASCFPEGDGICFKPLKGQANDQVRADIKAAFGWEA